MLEGSPCMPYKVAGAALFRVTERCLSPAAGRFRRRGYHISGSPKRSFVAFFWALASSLALNESAFLAAPVPASPAPVPETSEATVVNVADQGQGRGAEEEEKDRHQHEASRSRRRLPKARRQDWADRRQGRQGGGRQGEAAPRPSSQKDKLAKAKAEKARAAQLAKAKAEKDKKVAAAKAERDKKVARQGRQGKAGRRREGRTRQECSPPPRPSAKSCKTDAARKQSRSAGASSPAAKPPGRRSENAAEVTPPIAKARA